MRVYKLSYFIQCYFNSTSQNKVWHPTEGDGSKIETESERERASQRDRTVIVSQIQFSVKVQLFHVYPPIEALNICCISIKLDLDSKHSRLKQLHRYN